MTQSTLLSKRVISLTKHTSPGGELLVTQEVFDNGDFTNTSKFTMTTLTLVSEGHSASICVSGIDPAALRDLAVLVETMNGLK